MTVRFAQWTLDVHDVDKMLAFWSAALGYEVDGDHLRPPADAEPGSPTVWLQRTTAAKRGKLRGHVDLYVTADGGLATEVRRLHRPGRLPGRRRPDAATRASRSSPTRKATSSASCTADGVAPDSLTDPSTRLTPHMQLHAPDI